MFMFQLCVSGVDNFYWVTRFEIFPFGNRFLFVDVFLKDRIVSHCRDLVQGAHICPADVLRLLVH
jgi:hypothetical protein